MRCHEAKQKLTELASSRYPSDIDDELRRHIDECPACARQYEAAMEMRSSLKQASQSDDTETVSLAVLKTRIEAQVNPRSKKTERMDVMSRVVNQMKSPRYSLPLAAAVVIVALAVIIPFKVDNPVEYEVAFAGVDPTLALDENRVQIILDEIDVSDVDFSVGNCEQDCELTVTRLKSPDDVGKVIGVFEKVGNATVVAANKISIDNGHRMIFSISEDQLEEMRQVQIHISTVLEHAVNIALKVKDEDGVVHTYIEDDFDGTEVFLGESADGYFVESYTRGSDSVWIRIHTPDKTTVSYFQTNGGAEEYLRGCGIDPSFLYDDEADAAAKAGDRLPGEFALDQNFPNPFNPSTDIAFYLPEAGHVKLEVFNIKGQRITTLVDRQMSAGRHTVSFDGSNVASGVYLYRLQAGDYTETKKMSLVK